MFRFSTTIMIGCLLFVLTGCSSGEKIEGYILENNDGEILFAENASEEEYETWKQLTFNELTELSPGPSLIVITYEDGTNLQPGDHVSIMIDGDIATSYPAQAVAKKMEQIE